MARVKVEAQDKPQAKRQAKRQVKRQAKTQAEQQARKEAIATCPHCSQAVPRLKLLKHMWDEHREEMLRRSKKGGQARQVKRQAKTEAEKSKPVLKTLEMTLPGGEKLEGIDEVKGKGKFVIDEVAESKPEGEGKVSKGEVMTRRKVKLKVKKR